MSWWMDGLASATAVNRASGKDLYSNYSSDSYMKSIRMLDVRLLNSGRLFKSYD